MQHIFSGSGQRPTKPTRNSRDMNFIANESAQKLRGGFYTDPDIASFLARWVLEKQPKSVLESSCGDGAFLEAIADEKCSSLRKLFGCEMERDEAGKARERVPGSNKLSVEIHAGDFLKWFLFHSQEAGQFDGVVGNPPFIRYQYLPEEQQIGPRGRIALCGRGATHYN